MLSRYVVLAHDFPEPHFDFMLEAEGALLTWRLPFWPPDLTAAHPEVSLRVTPLPPHRLAYLDYEGPVSGNRGQVHRVEAGTFQWVERGADCWEILLHSERGRLHVTCLQQGPLADLTILLLGSLSATGDLTQPPALPNGPAA